MTTHEWPRIVETGFIRREDDIDFVLESVKAAWLEHPGMSLTQLVTFIAKVDPENVNKEIAHDHTYVSDREWMSKAGRYPYLAS